MVPARFWLKALVLIAPLLLSVNAFGYVLDDDVPDVTGRVARISYLNGDVQVKRSGATDWEIATQNLPIVEGDEIATSRGARLEIQFDVRTFVRLEENSVLRVATFKDEGIALSVPEGTASIRVTDYDRGRSYLEIDIPNSTIAIQRAGLYRIDVGDQNSSEARIRATDGGEARIYSDTSGFTLKNGRIATVYLTGTMTGEWNLADASQFGDEFDKWALDRDAVTAKRIKDAFFDKYYDRDIAGAEDLSDYGDWVYTKKYGYVWRPYRNAIGMYSDWSPYRYGHWRWIPPYGWTWINDEPWGWATYHYGRWVWDSGYWYWTPYGYYRYRRSWWQPALVVINIVSNNICWYPLPYRHHYHNYSRNFDRGDWGRRDDRGGRDRPGTAPTPNPIPTSTPTTVTTADRLEKWRQRKELPSTETDVPLSGVMTQSLEEFGRGRGAARRSSNEVARTILSKDPDTTRPIVLPSIDRVQPRITREIKTDAPPIVAQQPRGRIGAAERKTEQPLDEQLRRTRILGERTPTRVEPTIPGPEVTTAPSEPRETRRRTGAVDRPQITKREMPESPTQPTFDPAPQMEQKRERPRREEPAFEPRKAEQPRVETPMPKQELPRIDSSPPREPPRTEVPGIEPPVRREEQPRRERPSPREERRLEPTPRPEPPRIDSSPPREAPRIETPRMDSSPPREAPRREAPPRQEQPRIDSSPPREAPRVEAPPRREEPRNEPRNEPARRPESPPPARSEPKVERPSPPPNKAGGKKDGGD